MRPKKFLSFLFVLSTILVSACGPYWTKPVQNGSNGQPGKITVCLDLPKDQLPAAHEAVSAWDDALSQWMRIVPIDGEDNSWCSVYVHTTTKPNSQEALALAWASDIGGREVFMYVNHYEYDVKGILLHELGHAFGAQHVEGTLMAPHWSKNGYQCPDKVTVAQVASWHHVNLELMKWCYY